MIRSDPASGGGHASCLSQMIFSCLRARKKKDPIETARPPSNKKTPAGTGRNKNINVTVKLAPRTALLQTPKQKVGSRITEATSHRRAPNLHSRPAQSRRDASPPKTILEPPSPLEEPNGPELGPPRPTSPAGRASLFNGTTQQDELRQALARRAAKKQTAEEPPC